MITQKWLVDPSHSEVSFKVKHLMITTVTGYFGKFDLEVETVSDDFNTAQKIVFVAEIDSINTNDIQRDEHLRSADFFNSVENKYLKFLGRHYKGIGSDAQLTGQLTIGSVTRTITLDVVFGGIVVDGYSQTKAGFSVSGKLSRKEFGLTWDAVTEAGNIVVSDEVRINAEIQIVRQS
ncbi:YceI family protein [Sphingobacterium faecium]|uniref:YceI family protein n=1 Tax=Sphingobacterium faecium TaxID=34087 RepID=UPI002469BBA4|nr:YceI family protein [Sphingobacterium faecium]MDH5825698.1 YceI family protein [Sphingobacterium faecium]